MKVTFLGHAAFKIESDGKTVFIDPWLNGPTSSIKTEEVDMADMCLVTHDHGDHGYTEALEICKKTGAFFVGINELGLKAQSEGVENVHTLNIGGSVTIDSVTVTLVQAFHSTTIGAPTGFIVEFPSGTVYHAGDTGIFSSMELFAELYSPDIFLVPIGSYYTCGPLEAAHATKLIRPKFVIPMHYGTFPVIDTNPEEFKRLVAEKSPMTKVKVIKPGESIEFSL